MVYVDQQKVLLDDTANLVIHRDKSIAKVHQLLVEDKVSLSFPLPGMGKLTQGSLLIYDNKSFEVMLVGGGDVLLKDEGGQTRTLLLSDIERLFAENVVEIQSVHGHRGFSTRTLADMSKEKLENAQRRLEILGGGKKDTVSKRTRQRWRSKIVPTMSRIEQIMAVADRNDEKGNRTPRLPQRVESLAEQAISEQYNTPDCHTKTATFEIYQDKCEEAKVKPMSYVTFTKRVEAHGSTRKREGPRKDYQDSPIPLFLDYRYPIHGVMPHEICYIDLTTANLATISPTGMSLGKPIFGVATDGNTTQTRAFYLGYEHESAHVILMLLRDYVRRNGRLPKRLVIDRGSGFRSLSLKEFCRIYEIDVIWRQKDRPRSGSSVESIIGASEQEVIAKMKGNTRIMKNVRMVTKSVDPYARAEWTLYAAFMAFEKYLFNFKDQRIHPTLGITPHQYEQMRLLETGQREHVLVRFDENLMLMTSPFTKKRVHKLDLKSGIWADGSYYWHDDFKAAQKSVPVEVRVEPWCANVVYVYFNKRWIAAIARDTRPLEGRTRKEAEIALREARKKAKSTANKDRLDRTNTKKMLGLRDPLVFDERLGLQQREMEYLYERLGMTHAMKLGLPLSDGSTLFANMPLLSGRTATSGVNDDLPLTSRQICGPEESSIWEGADDYK